MGGAEGTGATGAVLFQLYRLSHPQQANNVYVLYLFYSYVVRSAVSVVAAPSMTAGMYSVSVVL